MSEIEEVKNILMQHRGETNAITSGKIADKVGINEDDTHPKTRKIIREIEERDNLPVLACNKGYYIAKTKEELNKYTKNLDNRIKGIKKRKELTIKNYNLLEKQNRKLI